jgi:hypothetical protein
MKNKILFSLIISFSISISILLWIYITFPFDAPQNNEFYFRKFDQNKERVFLIGSSHMGQLNTTLVNEIVSKNYPSTEVYNLAYSGDNPSKRLQHVEKTIALKPKLIIYGISFRDFQLDEEEKHFFLPDPKKIIKDNFEIEPQNTFNPELTTLKIIRDHFKNYEVFTESNKIWLKNNIFYDIPIYHIDIKNTEQLKKEAEIMTQSGFFADYSPTSPNVKALRDIISSLKNNNIDIILYETPLNQYYLNNISENDKENFNLMINGIAREFNIPVYDFTYTYSDNMIWSDITHVSYNKNAMIYSEDITQIILDKIKQ